MKLNAHIKWLHEEIEKWVSENIISPQQAVILKEKYTVEESKIPWGIIVFSSLGAVIAGLGVILLFAYNWHVIPRMGKLALIFAALAVAHISGFKLSRSQGAFGVLGEGLSLLGTMFFGAGIWLIAQIYHIEEHYPNAFMFWGFGAFLLALAMPSLAQGVLATVLLSIWCIVERTVFDSSMYAAPIVMAFGLFPLAWKEKSRLLLGVLLPAFVITFLSVLPIDDYEETIYFSLLLNFSAIFIALRFISASRDDFPEAAAGQSHRDHADQQAERDAKPQRTKVDLA